MADWSSSDESIPAERASEFDSAEDEGDDEILCCAKSLFDDYESLDAQDVWEHMKKKFDFCLISLREDNPLFDDYGRIKLTNFLRNSQIIGEFVEAKDLWKRQDEWINSKYLLSPLNEDRLLYDLPSAWFNAIDEETSIAQMKATDQAASHDDSDLLETKFLRDEVCRLRNMLSETDQPAAKKFDQDRSYFQSYNSKAIHQEMILDATRTSAYYDFIQIAKDQIRGKCILDVGTGSGILSMMCSRVGARLVVGIDAADETIKLAKNIVAANGFEESQIQLLNGKLENHDLWINGESKVCMTERGAKLEGPWKPFKCDIIVSEWMGYALLYEAMLLTVLDARDRFLIPGGLMLPCKASMQIWAVDLQSKLFENIGIWKQSLYGFDLSLLQPDEQQYLQTVEVEVVDKSAVVSEPFTFLELDLYTLSRHDLKELRRPFSLNCGAPFTSFVLSFFCTFAAPSCKEVILDTSPLTNLTHWRQTVCHVTSNQTNPTEFGCFIKGTLTISQGESSSRHLSIVIETEALHGQRESIFKILRYELK